MRVAKSKIPLILQKYRLWKNKSNKSEGFNNIQGWNPQKYLRNLRIYLANILRIYNVYWKSESTYNKSMSWNWGQTCYKWTWIRDWMYNVMNEISRWLSICFRKQIHKIRIPPSFLLKPAPTDLYAEIRGGYQNTNTKDFTDFTIYRGEIWENIEEIWRFTRISLIYTQTSTKHESHNAYTGYKMTHLFRNNAHQRCKLTNLSDINGPNELDHCCPLKRGNTRSAYHIWFTAYIYWNLKMKGTDITVLIEIHGFHNIWSEIWENIEEIHKTTRITE